MCRTVTLFVNTITETDTTPGIGSNIVWIMGTSAGQHIPLTVKCVITNRPASPSLTAPPSAPSDAEDGSGMMG